MSVLSKSCYLFKKVMASVFTMCYNKRVKMIDAESGGR